MKEKDIYYSAIEANIANKNRIYRKAVNSRQRPGLKRGLAVAAACFVVMASVVACVPEARAMVLNWLKPAVNSRQYIETPAAERTPETNAQKAVETAIESVRNKDIKVTVVDAADEQWKAWAERLSVSFDEILYDGEDVYITGRLKGNARDLIKRSSEYTVTETGEYTSFAPPDDLVVPYVGHSVSGGDMQYLLMSPLVDEFSSANVDKAYASDSMDISVRLPVGSGLKGNQQLTMFFYFTDMKTVRQNTSKAPDHISEDEYLAKINCLVALRIDGLTFDATAGTAAQAAMPIPAPVMLKGDVLAGIFSTDAEVVQKGFEYLKGFAPETILTAILFSMLGYFNGNNKTVFVMIQGLVQTLLVRLPMSYLMSIQPNASLTKIGLAAPVSTLVGVLLNTAFYLYFTHSQQKELQKAA